MAKTRPQLDLFGDGKPAPVAKVVEIAPRRKAPAPVGEPAGVPPPPGAEFSSITLSMTTACARTPITMPPPKP